MSILKIYKTQLTPAKNALLDNIEDYLSLIESQPVWYTGEDKLTYTSNDFQYVKPDIDIKIKINVPLNNNSIFDSIGNYLRLEQKQDNGESAIWYYFIIASKWTAQKTLELTCSMDTINTFHDFINNKDNWSDKTTIIREHQKPVEAGTNGFISVVDRYSEDFEPAVLLKTKDEKIEEPNTTGVKEWYLVYQTDNTKNPDGTENTNPPLKCYLYPSETIVYKRSGGTSPQTFTRTQSDFPNLYRYGVVNGKVSFNEVKFSAKYDSYKGNNFIIASEPNSPAGISSKNPSLTGYAQVGDTFTTTDNAVFTCNSVIWYTTSETGKVNIPMGVFTNGSLTVLATYINKFNTLKITEGYYVWSRNADYSGGWNLTIGLCPANKLSTYQLKDSYKIVEGSKNYRILKDIDVYSDNWFTGDYDLNWGRTFIYNSGNLTLNFDINVVNIFKIPASEYGLIPSVNELSSGDAIYKNGNGGESFKILPISNVDRTDPKIVKIITIPYCPTPIEINGTIESGNYSFIFDSDVIDIESPNDYETRLVYKNSAAPNFGKYLNDYTIGLKYSTESNLDENYTSYEYFLNNGINSITLKNILNEPKLMNSTYTNYRFVYDNVSKNIRMEDVISTEDNLNISTWYMPTNTIDSKILFKFDLNSSYNEIYDWDRVLISTRDNELPIYNSEYLNYIRYGYKTERENMLATAAAQQQQSYTNAAIGAGGGMLSGALVGAKVGSLAGGWGAIPGAVIGAVVGLAAGLAAGSASINAVNTSIENAQRSMSQKLLELQNTASTVINGSAAPDLMTNYSGNRLHFMLYEMPVLLKDALYDKLFYCGYSHPVQGKPEMDNRLFFNYLQCIPVFVNESTSRYNYYMADIKDRFNTGITKYHNISSLQDKNALQLYTDWKQDYENWYLNRDYYISVKSNQLTPKTNNMIEYDFTLSTSETIYQPGYRNGFYYQVEGLYDDWVDLKKLTNTDTISFKNGVLEEKWPSAVRFTLKNDSLGLVNKGTPINYQTKLDYTTIITNLSRPTLTKINKYQIGLNSQYTISDSSPYRYQLLYKTNDGNYHKYPYADNLDYGNHYTTAKSFNISSDFANRSISLNNVEQILYRVVNISKGVIGNVSDNNYKEFSQWGIYNL